MNFFIFGQNLKKKRMKNFINLDQINAYNKLSFNR